MLHAGGHCTRHPIAPALLHVGRRLPKEPLATHPGANCILLCATFGPLAAGLRGVSVAASSQHMLKVRGKSIPWLHDKEGKDNPLATGTVHCTGWWQDGILPLPAPEDISSVFHLGMRDSQHVPVQFDSLQGGTAHCTAGMARRRRSTDHRLVTPLCGVCRSAAGEASFLKCISRSRSLAIEALIKVEINFCQRTSRAQSVLFLLEPCLLARTESDAEAGSSADKTEAPESVCGAGGHQLL